MIMVSLRQRIRDFLQPRFTAVLWALVAIVISGLAWLALVSEFQAYLVSQQRTRLEAQLAGYNNALDTALARRLILLQGLQAFAEGELKSRGTIPPAEFQT